MKKDLLLLILALTVSCGRQSDRVTQQTDIHGGHAQALDALENNILIDHCDSLVYYYPNYTVIDHVCETMPEPTDESVLFCCGAAFTGEIRDDFDHNNIAGNHVSGGVLYHGYGGTKANTGCFAYYPDTKTWVFAVGDYAKHMKAAAEQGGCAFGQAMVILNGEVVVNKTRRDPVNQTSKNMYRVLAEYNNKLCIIDAEYTMSYASFIQKLSNAGVSNAIYLDMGSGWNYSYYRGNDGQAHYIHETRIPYTTNWIVFKK